MKSNKMSRPNDSGRDDVLRKAVKLAPIKKSGKDRHMMYSELEEEVDDEYITSYKQRESVLDYFDDDDEL